MSNNALSEVTVDSEGIDLSKISDNENTNKKALVALSKNFNSVNSVLSDLAQLESECDAELIEIRKEIAEKTSELKGRQKHLRNAKKIIVEKRLLKLGEREGCLKQIGQLGGKVRRLNLAKLIGE